MLWLVGPFDGDSEIFGLPGGQFGEFAAEGFHMQSSHFFVQFFGEGINTWLEVFRGEHNLCQALIGKAAAHYKTGMACGTT